MLHLAINTIILSIFLSFVQVWMTLSLDGPSLGIDQDGEHAGAWGKPMSATKLSVFN